MAILKNIGKAIKSAGEKVAVGTYNTVNQIGKGAAKVGGDIASGAGNLAKQAGALVGSIGGSASKSTLNNPALAGVGGANAFAPKSTANASYAPNATSAITGKPISTVGGVPNATSVITKQPVNTRTSPSIGNQYNALQRSSSAPTSVTPRQSGGGGGSGGGVSLNLADYLAGGGTFTGSGFGGNAMQTTTPATYSNYGGKTGTDQTTYYGGTALSLEAQAAQQQPDNGMGDKRMQNRAIIDAEEADAPRRRAEAEAAAAQAAQAKEAADAAATAALMAQPEDPEKESLELQARELQKQYEAIERQYEELSKPSAEYLAALEEEQRLTEEENQVKTGLSSALNEVNNQPVMQGFLTGQGARLQNLANTSLDRIAGQKVTLQQRLAMEQQRRQAALDVVRTKLNRAGSRADQASDRIYDFTTAQRKRRQDKEDKTYSVSAGETIYDSNGRVIAKGAYKPEGAAKPTEYERKNAGFAAINQLMQSTDSNGMPYTDGQYFTAEGFKKIVNEAAADGISRKEIIEQYAGNLSPWGAKAYGLTLAEQKALGMVE